MSGRQYDKEIEVLSNAIVSSENRSRESTGLLYTYALVSIGFGFMIGWHVVGLFAPASPLLSYGNITQALILCTIGVGATAISYLVCARFASYFPSHCLWFTIAATLCSQAVVVCAFAHSFYDIPIAIDIIAWILFGYSKAAICLGWSVYLSSLPSKHTGIAVGIGGVLGSVLYFFVFTAMPPSFSLVGTALLPIASLAMLLLLFKGAPDGKLLIGDDYNRPASALSNSAALSNGAHGIVYGFITSYVCLIGPCAAAITGLSGIIGCFFVAVLMKLAPKMDFDNGIVQRIAQPLVVIGLLLMPMSDGPFLIFCGCLVTIALAFVNIATWGTVAMENYEFHLQPILRFAARQAPLWVGFTVGAIITTLLSMATYATSRPLGIIAVVLVAFVIVSFSCYSGNDSVEKGYLEAIITIDEVPDEPPVNHPSFDERCAEVCATYGLSPRESEVFNLLARGRNAKIIQEELCVSASTAKTHIYRIYRKMGINSQQLLIDAVEGKRDPSALH